MSRPLHICVGVGAVATALTVATLAVPGAAVGASHAKATTPTLKVTIGKGVFTVSGSHTLQAGRVDIALKTTGKEAAFEIASFKKGYSLAKFKADIVVFNNGTKNGATPTAADIKHLDTAVAKSTLYGGLDAEPGQKISGSFVLPKAGTYYLYKDSNGAPSRVVKLTVTGPEAHRAAPKATATVKATSEKLFAGASTLPASGTITFKNVSTNSPHLLVLLHVKAGTTKKDVLNGFMGNTQPTFFLPGQVETDAIGEGLSQTVSYKVPAGSYAELCFFPDLQTGIPHAFMGMIRIVTLK